MATKIISFILIAFFTTTTCFAIDLEDATGKVTARTDTTITIQEYDYDLDKEVQNTYEIGSDVNLGNAESLSAIPTGATIEIAYVQDGDKRIAKTIILSE